MNDVDSSNPSVLAAKPSTPGYRREAFVTKWSRRLVSISLYLTLAAVCAIGAPLWTLCATIADTARGQARTWPRLRALGFFALYFLVEIVAIFGAALIWLGTFAGRAGGHAKFLGATAALQRWLSSTIFNGAVWLFSAKIEVEGLDLARNGPLLYFVRHASAADPMLAAAIVANPNRVVLRYVLKRELLWDPCLDIIASRLPNAFVDRRATHGRSQIDAVAQLAKNLDAQSAVVIYPEGTRFSRAKLERSVEKLGRSRHEKLAAIASGFRHVLPPRLGGPVALIEAAPGVDLLLIEHTGFEDAATFSQFWNGGLIGKTIRVRLRRFASTEIPASDRDVWLFERWAEMDAWIESSLASCRL